MNETKDRKQQKKIKMIKMKMESQISIQNYLNFIIRTQRTKNDKKIINEIKVQARINERNVQITIK